MERLQRGVPAIASPKGVRNREDPQDAHGFGFGARGGNAKSQARVRPAIERKLPKGNRLKASDFLALSATKNPRQSLDLFGLATGGSGRANGAGPLPASWWPPKR